MQLNLIIDFDSTFVRLETLDELAKIALAQAPDRDHKLHEIHDVMTAGMEGRIGFGESLSRRLTLFSPKAGDIQELIRRLEANITPSVVEHLDDIAEMASRVFIISGGFRECILPIAKRFNIPSDHVVANTFVQDARGNITGCDLTNPLSGDRGKVRALQAMNLEGRVVMVGDGYSDYETKQAGVADEFVAFVENVSRESVIAEADTVASDFGAVLDFCYSVKA